MMLEMFAVGNNGVAICEYWYNLKYNMIHFITLNATALNGMHWISHN